MQKPSEKIYTDRWGRPHRPGPQARHKTRKGAFACLQRDGCILLTYPSFAPDVPDLPGGGIDAGETPEEAVRREIAEETGMTLAGFTPLETFQQKFLYYADVTDEYWDYDQTFFLIEAPEEIVFEDIRDVETGAEDAGKMQWLEVGDLPNAGIHAAHRPALSVFLGIKFT